MKTLGIIIARAGSVGLKNKHLCPLLGRPVISYTFDYARAATRLDRIAVSSDSPEILDLAKAQGFDVVPRPAELATGDASVQAVLLHAMQHIEQWDRHSCLSSDGGVGDIPVPPSPSEPPRAQPFVADAIILLYGNCPVRPPGLVDAAIHLLETTGCDSVRSFAPTGKLHPNWMARLNGDRVEPYLSGSIHRRQDLEPLFFHDGAIVAVTRTSLLRQIAHPEDPHAFFGIDRRAIPTQSGETIEIDQEMDLYLAEAILRACAGDR
ncbi:MAG: cytidylyltransferase domain-containing protein [Tepidisphaerales bacterium]